MFTGLVAAQGRVRRARLRGGLLDLEVEAPAIARELDEGDSVAVNGVCLTAIDVSRKRFSAQAIEETLAITTLGSLTRGDLVNLELAARLSDRVGGHLVQGHIDGRAKVLRIENTDGMRSLWFEADDGLMRYMVVKGSVTLDGVSLTLVDVGRSGFQVSLIPHTLDVTTLDALEVGDSVNVEVDVIAKYVDRLMGPARNRHE